ncbi:MAG: DUF4423 domain-containing protein [Deltaproteobacteria bacterium]|nr:DUF4423 domain-containing protein [Deltaproteobacteria bacterium]
MLDVEPSFLSKILNRKRAVTEDTLDRFSRKLSLSPVDVQNFKTRLKNVELEPALQFQQITLDHFQMIADWYHYALLELVSTKGFKPEAKWVARRLGITPGEVSDAVDRLVRLGFLEVTPRGRWVNKSGSNTTVGNEFTAAAFRQLQRQVLEKALIALEEVPMERRDQSSMTMAIDASLLPEAKERIRKFRRELSRFLAKSDSLDEVYQLGISLYPLTQVIKE